MDKRCIHTPKSPFDGLDCRLDNTTGALGTAADSDIAAKVRTKLGRLLFGVQSKIHAARQSTVTKKRTKLLRTVTKKINAALGTIAKAQNNGKVSDSLADQLILALNQALAAAQNPGLQTP